MALRSQIQLSGFFGFRVYQGIIRIFMKLWHLRHFTITSATPLRSETLSSFCSHTGHSTKFFSGPLPDTSLESNCISPFNTRHKDKKFTTTYNKNCIIFNIFAEIVNNKGVSCHFSTTYRFYLTQQSKHYARGIRISSIHSV